MNTNSEWPVLPADAAAIVDAVLQLDRRVLLFGPMGSGKSTLAAKIARALGSSQRSCCCLSADPGSPAFGVPGSVATALWHENGWRVTDMEPLCTLDAGRFRLPLVSAVTTLAGRLPDGVVLVDAPGVVRGVAGRELVAGLCDAASVDAILLMTTPGIPPPLLQELRTTAARVYIVNAAVEAKRPGKRVRARQRTARWDDYLSDARAQTLDLDRINVTGTPPLAAEASAWQNKQVALLEAGRTLAIGEVQRVDGHSLKIRIAGDAGIADTLLIRDAVRSAEGFLETARPYAAERFDYLPPNDLLPSVEYSNGPRIVGRVGPVDVALVNGVFGDPMLHLRMRHQRRSLLFDLGDGERLPARLAHQVTDVFISHAHMDHIGGFLWLLRSRIGEYPPCRLYGPPGLVRHIAGFLQGILWDRIDNNAPRFEIMELDGNRVATYGLQAGDTRAQHLDQRTLTDGVLLYEPGFRIRAQTLDHRGTAVLAYAFEAKQQLNIRKDRLKARGLEPGPWLNILKQHMLEDNDSASIQIPDGSQAPVAELADDLVLATPGKKLVYATDLADTPDNRQRLVRLAQHAHTFFCECSYAEDDADFAVLNGHLTTRACGEIATEAAVTRLVPFHFSRRYMHRTQQLYDELDQHCSRVFTPASMT